MTSPASAVKVFFDGECPLCVREARFLEKKDSSNKLELVDIAAKDFSAKELGLTQEELMAEIHGQLPSGEIIKGMEVFRQAYCAIGYKAILVTKLPLLKSLFDLAYRLFAKHRIRIGTIFGRKCDTDTCFRPR